MRYIALLRGINVAGHRIIKMEDLRASFVAAGATDVATYIQSGNVVFSHSRVSVAKIEKQIAKDTGFDVPVVLRTADELSLLVEANPYDSPDDHLHVFFLPKPAGAVEVTAIEPERYSVAGANVYMCLPNGIGKSKLAGALMKALPSATARNWRTTLKLHAMATSG